MKNRWVADNYPPMEVREFEQEDDDISRVRFMRLHADNIGERQCREILAVVGAQIERTRVGWPEVHKGLMRFIVAYGYNPKEILWSELVALWRGGPVELEYRSRDNRLGRYDKFEEK